MIRSRTAICLILALFVSGLTYSQFTFVGVTADYGTKIKEPGFSAIVFYTVNEQIDITPNFTWYLAHKEDSADWEKKTSWWSANLCGHYNILHAGKLEGYGLMGLNVSGITTETRETVQGQDFNDKKTLYKPGLNVGIGGSVHLSDFFTPFAEVKVSLTDKDYTQAGIRLGILVRIAADKVRETEEY
jgi:hypothetical protein